MKKKIDTNFKFNLGDELEDSITGFAGVAVTRSQWIHNCNTYGIKPKTLKDGIPMENQWFDEPQLKLVNTKVMKVKNDTGGPCAAVPQTNR